MILAMLMAIVPLRLAAAESAASGPRLANEVCAVTFPSDAMIQVEVTVAAGEVWSIAVTPRQVGGRGWLARTAVQGDTAMVNLRSGNERATLRVSLLADGCRFEVVSATERWSGLLGMALEQPRPMVTARVALDKDRNPTVLAGGDVLDIAAGLGTSRRANAVYSPSTFRGLLLDVPGATAGLQPQSLGGCMAWFSGPVVDIRALDVWPLLGWRPASSACTFGHPESGKPHVIPREWMAKYRPFPWKQLSPVQLPFISIADERDFPRVKEQVDWLAANLKDWGFFCFGEWPLTQHNPEYDPVRRKAYLEGNRRTCEYAHSKGIKILRWVTDPDIEPGYYPQLYEEFKRKGWFADEPQQGEWLLDYTNPEVQQWIEQQYADLGATGPDFYWIDNNRPTKPKAQPELFPPDAFRNFYLSIQRGLLSTGRDDILMRSGASMWADYTAAGILDVYAPGPDVQNDWTEQQLYVAGELARNDYLCHWNLWRRSIDDFFPAGPQTIDQTRAMETLMGLTGLSFTTTDIGLPNIPANRLADLRRVVPVAECRPLDLYRFTSGPLPRWWVLNEQQGGHAYQVAGVFNWGLRTEETQFKSFEDLGLDPTGEYLVYDFWSQQEVGRFRGGIGLRVAPATGRALAIHAVGETPFIVATDRHVTMGAVDLETASADAEELIAWLTAGVKGETISLTVYAPPGRKAVSAEVVTPGEEPVKRREVAAKGLGDGLWQVPVPCEAQRMWVRVRFGADGDGVLTPLPPSPARLLRSRLGRGGNGSGGQTGLAASQDGGLSAPQDGGLSAAQDGGLPAPQDGGLPAPQDGGLSAPQDAGSSAPQDAGLSASQDGGLPAPQDGGLPAPLEAEGLLARARRGEAVVLVSPEVWSDELAALQEGLGLQWGLFRRPEAGSPWILAIGGGEEELPETALFRTTCVGFQPNVAEALVKPVGKGLVAIVRPDDGTKAWMTLLRRLKGRPESTVREARQAQMRAVREATSTLGRFRTNEERTEGTAPLLISPAMQGLSLSFHFKRLSHSVIAHEWAVPRISIFVNDVECPHNYNPCRPESPPQEWDSLYFAIPKGTLRFDGTDRVTVRSAVPGRTAEGFLSDLQAGLELCIETPAIAGQTGLVAPPRIAVTSPPGLDAFLGLDGGIRFVRRNDVDLIPHGGSPYNGWPIARPAGVSHCWFDTKGFTLEIRVPARSRGTVQVFAYDYEQVRTEELRFEGAETVTLRGFGDGQWVDFPFDEAASEDGVLMIEAGNPRGGNCVLSRVRVVFEQ